MAETELAAEAAGEPAECDTAYLGCCTPPLWMYGNLKSGNIDGSFFTVYDSDAHGFDGDLTALDTSCSSGTRKANEG
jgi:hypothetical protein